MDTQHVNVPTSFTDLERERVRRLRILKVNNILLVAVPVIGIPLMILVRNNRGLFYLVLILILLNAVRSLLSYFTNTHAYENRLVSTVLRDLVPRAFSGCQYFANPEPPVDALQSSGLLKECPPEMVEAVEQYRGSVSGREFEITRLLGRCIASGRRDVVGDICFDGLFVWLDSNDAAHAESAPEAAAPLNTAGFAATLDLEKRHHDRVRGSVVDGRIYLSINKPVDLRTIDLHKSVLDPAAVNEILAGLGKLIASLNELP